MIEATLRTDKVPAPPTLSGGRGRNRTFNKRIKSPLLCQLSYAPGYSVFSFVSVRP